MPSEIISNLTLTYGIISNPTHLDSVSYRKPSPLNLNALQGTDPVPCEIIGFSDSQMGADIDIQVLVPHL